MQKKISAGIIFMQGSNILLGHSTGNKHWDIPKGLVENGELPIKTALRETKEETNILVTENELIDLGEFSYNKHKNLHLFLCKEKNIDLKSFKCTSFFTHFSGKFLPEIDELAFFNFHEAVETKTAKSLSRLLLTLKEDIFKS